VATHFSRLLRHAWATVGLVLFPGHHTGKIVVHTGESKDEVVPVLNPRHEDVLGSGGVTPRIFDLGTRRR
jgi:hypothetical protein